MLPSDIAPDGAMSSGVATTIASLGTLEESAMGARAAQLTCPKYAAEDRLGRKSADGTPGACGHEKSQPVGWLEEGTSQMIGRSGPARSDASLLSRIRTRVKDTRLTYRRPCGYVVSTATDAIGPTIWREPIGSL